MRYLILLFLSFSLLTGCDEQSADNSNDGGATDSAATTEAEVEPVGPKAPAPVEFPSLDDLTISAMVYEVWSPGTDHPPLPPGTVQQGRI